MTGETELLIAVATYKRPDGIAGLLESLIEQTWSGKFRVTVVDNDPEGSAAVAVAAFDERLNVEYLHEPTPGIAAARNRALTTLRSADAVVFVDDDELADPTWLESLVATAQDSGADVVAGPVDPELPEDSPWWVRTYQPHVLHEALTGTPVKWPATNNAIVQRRVLEALDEPYFSEAFSETGGSDAEFFWRCRQAGFTSVWCSEAVVRETIPPVRLTLKWWWQRSVKQGNVSGRLMIRERSRVIVVLIGLARIAVGLLTGPLLMLNPFRPSMKGITHLPKGIGTINAVRGQFVYEYRRPVSGT